MANYQSNPIRVQITRLQSIAKQIRVEAGEYRRTGRQLFSAVSSSDGWQGQDALAFRNQLQGFEEDIDNMAKLMESYSAFLDEAAKAYRQLQDSAVQQAKSLWR